MGHFCQVMKHTWTLPALLVISVLKAPRHLSNIHVRFRHTLTSPELDPLVTVCHVHLAITVRRLDLLAPPETVRQVW